MTLTNSIRAYGQIVPVLVVSEQDRYILIDGYKRFAALKACGHDCISIQNMGAGESASLFQLLAQNNECKLEAIEQAAIIEELRGRFSFSFSEIGARLGRNKSWVKRRLDLIESLLPDEVHQAVDLCCFATSSIAVT